MPLNLTSLTARLFRRPAPVPARAPRLTLEPLEARDVPATLTVSSLGDLTEGGNAGGFRVTRDGDTTQAQYVLVATPGGTATAGTDYTGLPAFPTYLMIPAGASSADIYLTPVDDAAVEGTETISISVAEYSVAGPSGWASGIISPFDYDTSSGPTEPTLPTITAGTMMNATEGGMWGAFFLHRTGDTSGSLTVAYTVGGTATVGADYTALSGTATFAPDNAFAGVYVAALADSLAEPTESVILYVQPGTGYTLGGTSSATLTVTDTTPVVTVEKITDATEGGASGVLRFTRTGDLSQPLTVSYTVDGDATSVADYGELSGSVTFAVGGTTASVNVVALADNVSEPTESVVLALLSGNEYATGTESVAAVNIWDTGAPVVTVVKITDAAEDGAIGTFRFTRTGDLSQALTVTYTVSGTATPGNDYTALSGSITFPANTNTTPEQSASVVSVEVLAPADGIADPDETVVVTVASGVGYTVGTESVATITIADETPPTLIDQQTFQLTGSNGDVYVTLTVTYNAPGAVGLYTWAYAVTNPSANNATLTDFGVAVTGSDIANLASSLGWAGTIGGSGVSWLGGTGLAPGVTATFSFTTEPREVGTGTVSTGNAGGFFADLPVAPAPRALATINLPNIWALTNPATPDYQPVPDEQAVLQMSAVIRNGLLIVRVKKGENFSNASGGFKFEDAVTGSGTHQDTDSLQAAVRWSDPSTIRTDVGHATNATPLRNGIPKRVAGATWTLDRRRENATWETRLPPGATHAELMLVYTDTVFQPPTMIANSQTSDRKGADLPIIAGSFSADLRNGVWEVSANLDHVQLANKGIPKVSTYKTIIESTRAALLDGTGYLLKGRPDGLELSDIDANNKPGENKRVANENLIKAALNNNRINALNDTGFDIAILD